MKGIFFLVILLSLSATPLVYAEVEKGFNYDKDIKSIENNMALVLWTDKPNRILDENNNYVDYIMTEDSENIYYTSYYQNVIIDKTTGEISTFTDPLFTNLEMKLSHILKESPNKQDNWSDIIINDDQLTNYNSTDVTLDISTKRGDFEVVYNIKSNGFEYTYKYTNNDLAKTDQKFGFTTMCDGAICNEVVLDDIPIEIGESKGKTELVTAALVSFGDMGFDFKNEVHDYTWSMSHPEENKLLIDFTHAKGSLAVGETLEVDPSLYISTLDPSRAHQSGDVTHVSTEDNYGIHSSGGDSFRTALNFDISSIPTIAVIDSANYTNMSREYFTSNTDCDLVRTLTDPLTWGVGDGDAMLAEVATPDSVIDTTSGHCVSGTTPVSFTDDWSAAAITDLQSVVTGGSGNYWIAFHSTDGGGNTGNTGMYINSASAFSVVYTIPSDPPFSIDDLTSTGITGTSVDLDWTEPELHGESLIGYMINYTTPQSQTVKTTGTVFKNDTGVIDDTLTGLDFGTDYSATVSAWTIYGTNVTFANVYNFTTANPPSVPTGLALTPLSGTEIDLDWDDGLAADNIIGWRIFSETPVAGGWIKLVNDTASATSFFSDTGLGINTQNNYMVAGINATGVGDNSTAVAAYTFATPSTPTGLTVIPTTSSESTSLDLDWDDGLAADNIIGWRIFEESPVGGGWTLLEGNTTTSTSSYTDSPKTTKTEYNYMVAGINSTGVGSNSTAAAETTWGVPDPVTLFTIISATIDTLTLNFTAAIPFGYEVTDYEVLRDNVFLSYIGNVTSHVDTLLDPVTSYEYSVRALSSFGNSTWVNATGTTVTSPPTGLTVNDCYHTCTTQLNLEWIAPVPSTGVNGYKIEFESPIGDGWGTLVGNTTDTTLFHNDTSLANDGVFHNYRVIALTPDGESQVSNTFAYTTHKLPDSVDDLVVTTNALLQFILNWGTPELHGSLSGYNINYTTPAGDPLIIEDGNTGSSSTTDTISGKNPTVEYSWRVAAVTNHGVNATFSNISNGTLTSEVAVGDLEDSITVQVNPDAEPIWYVLMNTNTVQDVVQVRYNSNLEVDCNVDRRIAGTTTNFTSLSETIASGYVYHNFTLNNAGYDIIDWDCFDQTDPTIDGQYSLTQGMSASGVGGFANVPIFAQMGNFSAGLYGTDGDFGGIDLITMLIVIVSMLGFNRTNPALGVGVMTTMLGAAWYFELIEWQGAMLGAVAMVLVLAIGMGLKKRD